MTANLPVQEVIASGEGFKGRGFALKLLKQAHAFFPVTPL